MDLSNTAYKQWFIELKGKIRSTQVKVAVAANSALIQFYWELGKMIAEKENVWGSKLIDQVAKDLREEIPDIRGLSRSNLFYCKQFYQFYQSKFVQQTVGQLQDTENQLNDPIQRSATQILKQPIAQIPWGHNIAIFSKAKTIDEAMFYVKQTINNNWSRDTLALQIKTGLYKRSGKAISNFSKTLPEPQSDLAQQTLKDPYVFDFMTLTEKAKEKDIEKQLVLHITKFLLELGKGFAFVAQQHHLEVGGNDYYIDLLFYHTRLKCYVVIELKNTRFIPEYAGKLNFYLSAVDTLIKQPDDNPAIGILLCREKNNIEAEFALRDIHKPMGVSEFQITEHLPENLKSSLPTIEEIESEFQNLEQDAENIDRENGQRK